MNEQERRIREADKRRHIGVVLVVLGVLLFVVQVIDLPSGAMTRIVIGGAFVVGYLYRREYGLLIPGCILLGLGLGRIGGNIWNVFEYGSIGLGVGFLAIYVVDRLYRGTTPWWPLVPGLILVAKGLAHGELSAVLSRSWPIGVIVVGVLLLISGFCRPR